MLVTVRKQTCQTPTMTETDQTTAETLFNVATKRYHFPSEHLFAFTLLQKKTIL